MREGSREGEALGGEAAGDERGEGRAGPGDGIDGDARGDGLGDEFGAGVGDGRGAGVGDEGDACASLECVEEFFGAAGFVVQVIADGGCGDAEVVQELRGLAGVLAGDAVGGAEDAQRAESDVFEVADGCGDEVEAGCEWGVVRSRGVGHRMSAYLRGMPQGLKSLGQRWAKRPEPKGSRYLEA